MELNWTWLISGVCTIFAACIAIAYKEPKASERLLRPTLRWLSGITLLLSIGVIFGVALLHTELKGILKGEALEALLRENIRLSSVLLPFLLMPIVIQALELIVGRIEDASIKIEKEKTEAEAKSETK